ncbi:MAG: hypothetical protein FOGNACKC_04464 [Anaerolineae bacterium]|nr:hypothetical protein [Anaerolineae bacterium]
MSAFRRNTLWGLLVVFWGLTGCAGTPAPVEHQVKVQDAQTGRVIAGANITAQIDVRYTVSGTTNTEGVAQLAFDSDRLELHDWAKFTVEAEGYPATSVLGEVRGPTTVIELGQPPAAPPPTSEPAPTPENNVITATTTATGTAAELPPPGPLAQVPPADRANYYSAKPDMSIDPNKVYQATIITSKGNIVVSLDAVNAPESVNNFIFLSQQGFYDGLTFHRVEPGFVIQGGDPLGTGQGEPGYTIPGEFTLKHGEGALAMARLPDQVNPNRDSSGSQFYITLAPTPFLDGEYSVFGQVEQGMDVVRSIEVGDKIERIIVQQ